MNTPPDYPYGSCAFLDRAHPLPVHGARHGVCLHEQGARARAGGVVAPADLHPQPHPGRSARRGDGVAVYRQTNYVDPDTGETVPGCYTEVLSPVDCAVERTFPALNIGGTSGSDETPMSGWTTTTAT